LRALFSGRGLDGQEKRILRSLEKKGGEICHHKKTSIPKGEFTPKGIKGLT